MGNGTKLMAAGVENVLISEMDMIGEEILRLERELESCRNRHARMRDALEVFRKFYVDSGDDDV